MFPASGCLHFKPSPNRRFLRFILFVLPVLTVFTQDGGSPPKEPTNINQ